MDDHRPDSVFSISPRFTKYVVSFALFYCNIVLGVCFPFLSPLVLEFSRKLNAPVDQVSVVFSVILVCYLASAILGTVLFKYVNRQLVLVFLWSLMATAFFTIPNATTMSEFLIYSSLIGLGGGGYDTAQTAWMIDIWRDESPPFILTQHFTYSLGTLAPPLLLAHFLTKKVPESGNNNETVNVVPLEPTDLSVPFGIAGTLVIFAIFTQLALYITFKARQVSAAKDREALLEESEEGRSQDSIVVVSDDTSNQKIRLIALSCCTIGFYQGLELCTQQFLPTFANFSEVKLTEAEGARVLFGLQLGFTIGRFVGIGLVLKIAPHFIVAGNLLLLLVSNTILLVWGGSDVEWLWLGSIMIGVGMSTVFPAFYAYIEKYLFVTDTVAGVITVSGSFVSSIYPLIVGNAVQTNPQMMTYVNYVSIVICSCGFGTLFWLTHCKNGRRNKKLT